MTNDATGPWSKAKRGPHAKAPGARLVKRAQVPQIDTLDPVGNGEHADPASDAMPWRTPDDNRPLALFLPCPRGLEGILADELAGLGVTAIEAGASGVHCTANWPLAVRLNVESRIASRVLLKLVDGPYRNERDIERLAATIHWEQVLGPRHTLRVDVRAHRARVKSLNLTTLRIKDAIVDRLRERFGERPDIDTRDPDIRVMAFVGRREAVIYLDLSGENLFKRGWRGRDDKGAAPLKENLAAALPLLAGWTPGHTLLDPFCGSGTIVIEAAQLAGGLAPGWQREFGFQRLAGVDQAYGLSFNPGAQANASDSANSKGSALFASDIDAQAVRTAKANAERAGLSRQVIQFSRADVAGLRAPNAEPGWIVTNPPYGDRLGAITDDAGFLQLGRHLRSTFAGWTLAWLTSDHGLPGRLGLRAKRRIPIMNGNLDCRLFVFDLG